jgi:hypothetical protein
MNDEDLSRLLRELPREEPSFDFTNRVLARVDGVSGRKPRKRAAALALAGAALLGAVLSQGYVRERYQRSQAAARVRELRHEYRELQSELEKIRTLTRELEPVLDLGGTQDVEFVFDLRHLARQREGQGAAGAVPVSRETSNEEKRSRRTP